MRKTTLIASLAALTAAVTAGSAAAAPPENTARPTISGAARAGTELTASNGTWANSPTSFAYQWQRCASDTTGCTAISGAAKQTYTLATADIGRTVRILVTATNASGHDNATSEPTDIVASKNGPKNTVRPAVGGNAVVGDELSVSNGSWTPTPASYRYQWQRCDTDGTNCFNVDGATGRTYGVRAIDEGNRMRALVTAVISGGERATIASSLSDIVQTDQSNPPPPTVNKPPTIQFIALTRVGARVYARFRVCDDGVGRITIVERDQKARQLGYRRTFAVRIAASCGAFTRSWIPAARFRTPGRFVVALQAMDKSKRASCVVAKSLVRR